MRDPLSQSLLEKLIRNRRGRYGTFHDLSGQNNARGYLGKYDPERKFTPDYHVVVGKHGDKSKPDGGIDVRNPLSRTVNQAKGRNSNSFGISRTGFEGEELTPFQKTHLTRIVKELQRDGGGMIAHGLDPHKDNREANWLGDIRERAARELALDDEMSMGAYTATAKVGTKSITPITNRLLPYAEPTPKTEQKTAVNPADMKSKPPELRSGPTPAMAPIDDDEFGVPGDENRPADVGRDTMPAEPTPTSEISPAVAPEQSPTTSGEITAIDPADHMGDTAAPDMGGPDFSNALSALANALKKIGNAPKTPMLPVKLDGRKAPQNTVTAGQPMTTFTAGNDPTRAALVKRMRG